MNFKLLKLLAFLLSFFLFSCSNNGNSTEEPTPSSSITANINGVSWASISNGATANVSTSSSGGSNQTVLQIIGLKIDLSAISIQFPISNLTVGTYNFGPNGNGLLSYTTSNANISDFYTNSQAGTSFSVTLTEVNFTTGIISGTFSGTLKNTNGQNVTITNGSINSVLFTSSSFYNNGTMSLKKNNGATITMDGDSTDGKFVMISQNTAVNAIQVIGYYNVLDANFGSYTVSFPKNVTPGTYNVLTSSGYNLGISNTNGTAAYNTISGTITITSHNGNIVIGTFNYQANNGTQTVTISNGNFNITHN